MNRAYRSQTLNVEAYGDVSALGVDPHTALGNAGDHRVLDADGKIVSVIFA